MATLHIQFWAPFRGSQDVFVQAYPSDTAESLARRAVHQATQRFEARWPFPASDRRAMVCTGLTDGYRRVNACDLPDTAAPLTTEGGE